MPRDCSECCQVLIHLVEGSNLSIFSLGGWFRSWDGACRVAGGMIVPQGICGPFYRWGYHKIEHKPHAKEGFPCSELVMLIPAYVGKHAECEWVLESFVTFSSAFTSPQMFPLSVLGFIRC